MVVLLPKGDGDFRGVGLVEVLWKAILGWSIGRLGGRCNFMTCYMASGWDGGMGTASLKDNLLIKLHLDFCN